MAKLQKDEFWSKSEGYKCLIFTLPNFKGPAFQNIGFFGFKDVSIFIFPNFEGPRFQNIGFLGLQNCKCFHFTPFIALEILRVLDFWARNMSKSIFDKLSMGQVVSQC